MKLMDHLHWEDIDDENLNFFKAIGVDCLLAHLPGELADGRDPTDEMRRVKKFVEDHGLELYAIHSHQVPRDRIIHGQPGREEELANWIKVIRAIGAVGVPATATTFYAIGHFRTEATTGRGGARYSTWDFEEFSRERRTFPGQELSEERLWENMAWWVERIVPVAEEAGVRIALHPDDPPTPEPLGGAARIVISIENYQRIFDIRPSPALGMLFCQGCVAEMAEDVKRSIRYMAERDKIVFVHFRNIRGTRESFQEVFIDEGQEDMIEAMKTYRDAGYTGPFMMDHTPGVPHHSGEWAGRAFANGYIRALLQMVYAKGM